MCLEARCLEKVWDHCLGRGREGRGKRERDEGRIDGVESDERSARGTVWG